MRQNVAVPKHRLDFPFPLERMPAAATSPASIRPPGYVRASVKNNSQQRYSCSSATTRNTAPVIDMALAAEGATVARGMAEAAKKVAP